jgi:hypothetical protein
MADFIGERWKAVFAKTGLVDRDVPKCLLGIMNCCIAPRTQDWPLAGELRERIEDLHGDLMVLVDNDYEIVFTDLVQAPETPLAQAQTSGLDLGSEEFDEDGHSVLIWASALPPIKVLFK